jgi:hypothetical protein
MEANIGQRVRGVITRGVRGGEEVREGRGEVGRGRRRGRGRGSGVRNTTDEIMLSAMA